MYSYESTAGVGGKYRDDQTGVEGFATCIEFHQHACERVILEVVDGSEIKNYIFDAARLTETQAPPAPPKRQEPVDPPRVLEQPRTGGGTSSPVRNRR